MSPDPITSASVPERSGLLSTEAEAATFFMNLESGQYLMLQATGRRIWQLIDGRACVADIVDQLVKEYEVDPETCRHETVQFLETLRSHGAVDVAR